MSGFATLQPDLQWSRFFSKCRALSKALLKALVGVQRKPDNGYFIPLFKLAQMALIVNC